MSKSIEIIGICNTGPLISAFQCGRIDLIQEFFDLLYIPEPTIAEYEFHGYKDELEMAIKSRFVIVENLTANEEELAWKIAEDIMVKASNGDPSKHFGEASAIALFSSLRTGAQWLFLDEFAAREVAKERRLPYIGFIGVLEESCRRGLVTVDEVKDLLGTCIAKGTWYSPDLINRIYKRLREEGF